MVKQSTVDSFGQGVPSIVRFVHLEGDQNDGPLEAAPVGHHDLGDQGLAQLLRVHTQQGGRGGETLLRVWNQRQRGGVFSSAILKKKKKM